MNYSLPSSNAKSSPGQEFDDTKPASNQYCQENIHSAEKRSEPVRQNHSELRIRDCPTPETLPLVASYNPHCLDDSIGQGYIPSSVYSTRTQYRDQTYPTYAHSPSNTRKLHPSSSALAPPIASSSPSMTARGTPNFSLTPVSPRNNRDLETVKNLYNTSTLRSLCYDSGDELKTPSPLLSPRASPGGGRRRVNQAFNFVTRTGAWANLDGAAMTPEGARSCGGASVSLFTREATYQSTVGSTALSVSTRVSHQVSSSVEGSGSKFTSQDEVSSQGNTTVQQYESHVEISKPFEMSDVYRYSERLRKQRQHGSVTCTPDGRSPSGQQPG